MPGWVEEEQGRIVDEMRRLFSGVAEQFRDLLGRTPDPDKTMTIEHPKYGCLDTHLHFSDFLWHVDQPRDVSQGQWTAMLRQQGYAGILTDYIFYLMERTGRATVNIEYSKAVKGTQLGCLSILLYRCYGEPYHK